MRSRDRYLEALARISVMPEDEQRAVARQYAATRDLRAAERLVLGNQRLVLKIARDLGGGCRRSDFMDLVQEGNAGLLHAIDRFDPNRDTKLSSYAGLWIRAFIMRHLMNTCRIVRIGSTRQGRRQFFARSLPEADISLDAPLGHQEEGGFARGRPAIETYADDDARRPDVLLEERERQAQLQLALGELRSKLDARDRTILEARLLSESPTPLHVLAKRFDVTGERTRQLEQRLVHKLRACVAEPAATLAVAA